MSTAATCCHPFAFLLTTIIITTTPAKSALVLWAHLPRLIHCKLPSRPGRALAIGRKPLTVPRHKPQRIERGSIGQFQRPLCRERGPVFRNRALLPEPRTRGRCRGRRRRHEHRARQAPRPPDKISKKARVTRHGKGSGGQGAVLFCHTRGEVACPQAGGGGWGRGRGWGVEGGPKVCPKEGPGGGGGWELTAGSGWRGVGGQVGEQLGWQALQKGGRGGGSGDGRWRLQGVVDVGGNVGGWLCGMLLVVSCVCYFL